MLNNKSKEKDKLSRKSRVKDKQFYELSFLIFM